MFKREIYANDTLKITEYNNIFTIEFEYPNPLILESLIKTHIIPGAASLNDYKTIKFKANKVQTFIQYQEEQKRIKGSSKLKTNDGAYMISTLTAQLNYLIAIKSHAILDYNPKNILVINDSKFVCIQSNLLAEIENDQMLISCPFTETEFFVSPEMLKIKELPSYVHYKAAYFSLGCLILCILLGNIDFYEEYIKSKTFNNIFLDTLHFKDTKLYHFLERCLKETPDKRTLIYL
jgi:serine/threonine protein kinase